MSNFEEVHDRGCNCTGCLTGRSISLDCASGADIAGLLAGRLVNLTGAILPVTATVILGEHEFKVRLADLRVFPPASTTNGERP